VGYALDATAQKMVHALCEVVLLRSRLGLPPARPESVIVRDLLEDIAGAFGLYAGLPEDAPGDGYDTVKFVYEIHRCTETWHVGRALSRCPELSRFAFHPYLSITDMNKLEEWKAGGAEAAKGP
jgi:hypothetical protein